MSLFTFSLSLQSLDKQNNTHSKGGRGEIDMLSENTKVGQEIQDNDIPYWTFQDIPIRIIPTNIKRPQQHFVATTQLPSNSDEPFLKIWAPGFFPVLPTTCGQITSYLRYFSDYTNNKIQQHIF